MRTGLRSTVRSLLACAAGLAVLAASASFARAGEVYALLANTQQIKGDVPAGEDIRIEFPIPAEVEPRLKFSLTGATTNQPISISELHLIGPDQKEIFLPEGAFFDTRYSGGNPTLTFSGWTSTMSGNHQILIRTRSRVLTHAKGRLTVKRTTKISGIMGDATSNVVKIALQPGDISSLTIKRTSGTAPKVVQYKLPSGITSTPGQRLSKTGTRSNGLYAVQFGEYQYTIGYQAAPAEGTWKATLKIIPFHGGTPAFLRLRNSPGIPLSVRPADRNAAPATNSTSVGVATDGNVIVVTSVQAGILTADVFDGNLARYATFPNSIGLSSAVDFSPGETPSGHRVLKSGSFYFVAVSTASGQELAVFRLRANDLVRDGFAQIATSSPDPTTDFFFGADTSRLSIGIAHPPNGHTVHLVNATDFAVRNLVSIGGTSFPQRGGGAAVWRADDSVFELWTPDTLDYHGPSDLHRVLYTANWSPTTADAKPVNDLSAVETMPSAAVVDAKTGVTILHYVVADNPPLDPSLPGSGPIHRRLFDATGVEIPGSLTVLPRASCNRPAATILGNAVYLAYETPFGPIVERYGLLR